jgi:mRNA-degrading endonuclease RelE of RelBE toxin-antitoxin system
MARKNRYSLNYGSEALEHLDKIERNYHNQIREAIVEQHHHTPAEETRNRKPLKRPAPFDASWELRCGADNRFRVFYDVDVEDHEVTILAIGVKDRQRLLFAGVEYKP